MRNPSYYTYIEAAIQVLQCVFKKLETYYFNWLIGPIQYNMLCCGRDIKFHQLLGQVTLDAIMLPNNLKSLNTF